MQGTCEEAFLMRKDRDTAEALLTQSDLGEAKEDAAEWASQHGMKVEVWHLDFKSQKMTLVKVYKPRPKDDEEKLVEYV